MTSSKRRLGPTLVFGAVLAALSALAIAPRSLAAGPTAQDLETARVLYKEGKELRAAGNLRGALEKLRAAHALGHTPITGAELAHTQEQLGLLVEARETCLGVARMPVESDETQRSADARDEAAKLAESLKPRIATLRIRIVGLASGATPIVTVDNENVPAISLHEPRKVNPGHHQVTAHVEGGTTVTAGVDLAESQTRELTLLPPAAPISTAPPHAGASDRHGLSGLAIVGLSITGVGILIGASAGLVAMGDYSGLKNSCTNGACPPTQWAPLDSARTVAMVSTVGFVAAGAGIVMFVIGLTTGGSKHEEAPRAGLHVTPDLGVGYAGVHGAF